jgi:hypothetical protein
MDDQFMRMLPAICRQASIAFGHLDDEQREERIAEVVANAYCALVRLAKRGRLHLAFPTPLASFAIRQVRAGRRVGCNLNVRDITSRHCQRAKGLCVERLDRYDHHDEAWREIVVEDRRAGPDHVVMVRLDFAAWLESLTKRNRRFADLLAADTRGKDVARRFGITHGRVSLLRSELRDDWHQFQGEPVAA